MIKLQLPTGFENEAFLSSLDVERGVVWMKRQVKIHLSLSCLCFLIQEFFSVGWAPFEILLCIDNGFQKQGCDFIQIGAAVENPSHKQVHLSVHISLFEAESVNSQDRAVNQSNENTW